MTWTGSARGRSETRVYRIIAVAFGPAALVFGLLVESSLAAQWKDFPLWWMLLTVFSIFFIPLVLCTTGTWAGVREIRTMAGVGASSYLLGLASLGPALGGHHLPGTATPWLLAVAAIGTTLAALAWPAGVTAGCLLIGSVLVAVDREVAGGPQLFVTGLQDGLYTLMFSTVFAALALVATGSGRLVDRASAAARSEAAGAAAVRARLQERSRINALVHDNVLATLLAAARGRGPTTDGVVRIQARHALTQLSQLQSEQKESASLSTVEFAWILQAMTTDVAPEATFSYQVQSGENIPRQVAESIAEATLEALRNSVRHADRVDRMVNRSVHIRAMTNDVEVEVLDDGVGFDESRVSPTRLGISVSIRDRMHWLDGGKAGIASAPDIGTRVSLAWKSQ